MPLDTYANLKTAIGSWLARDVSNDVDDFIDLAEAELRRRLKTLDGETSTTINTVAGTSTVNLPSGFRGLIGLAHSSDPRGLNKVSIEFINQTYAGSVNGRPLAYAIGPGNVITLAPTPDAIYTLDIDYRASFTALSDANTSNWILASHPGAYLFGALKYSTLRFVDKERYDAIIAQFETEIGQIITDDNDKRDGSVSQSFVIGATP